MDRLVAFLCGFLCAVALLGSSGTLAPETQSEERGPAQGAGVQNKAPSVIGCPVQRYPVRFGRDIDANLIDLSSFTHTTIEEMILADSQRHSAGESDLALRNNGPGVGGHAHRIPAGARLRRL